MTDHYFTDHPRDFSGETSTIQVTLGGRELTVHLAPGVFSATRLDKATRILLDRAPAASGTTMLDLGCGWGPIALDLALRHPEATVWAVDVNPRALELTRRNAAVAGANNIVVYSADEALRRAREEGVRFDAIRSNPPVRIGKAALSDLLLTWFGLLADGGDACWVQSRHLGADSVAAWLADQGLPCTRVASKNGFRVLSTRRTRG